MKTLYILDGHSLAYRAFFALPLELQTRGGLHTNAVLGFTNMLLRLLETRKPDYLAVAFDYPAPTFRHRQYEAYKATREKTPAELGEQLPVIKEVIRGFRIPTYELEGYEADDLIGTFARRAEKAGLRVMIVTADADFYQLLSAHVRLLLTRRGLSELEEYDPERLLEQYGLTPAQWVDFKALKGDSSDHVPGVPGIGEKRAMQLLKRFGSLERLLAGRHEITGKVGASLAENSEQALLSRELVRIITNVPLSFQLEDCRSSTPDWERLHALFGRLEFTSLLEKIPGFAAGGVEKEPSAAEPASAERAQGAGYSSEASQIQLPLPGEDAASDTCTLLESEEALSSCLELLHASARVSLWALQSASRRERELQGVALTAEKGETYVLFFEGGFLSVQAFRQVFQQLIADPARLVITHDLKILYRQLIGQHLQPACSFFDTMLAAYLVDPDSPSLTLPRLAAEHLGSFPPEPSRKADPGEKRAQQIHFLARGSRSLSALKDVLVRQLEIRQLQDLYYNLELPLVRVLAKMERQGIRVQESVLSEIAREIDSRMAELEEEIFNLAGSRFNLNSPRQLSRVLFEELQLPTARKIKTGYSTDARVLEELAKSHPIAERLLRYRTLAKIKSTYLEGLRPLLNPETGKIHTTFNQAVTATGRLSSSDPNLQNIPIKLEEGRRLRRAFTVSGRGKILLAADYSQIELRIMAHLSGDPNFLDAFRRDQDIHTRTAAEVFNVPLEEVTPLLRSRAKAVNFGIIYGISDYGLARDLKISRTEAREYIENYFSRYPGVKDYSTACIEQARSKGYVTTVMNRRRYLTDINHVHPTRRSFAERMARNTPIQGSAADIIKAAMLAVDHKLETAGFKAAMLLQVHDELIFELPAEELSAAARIIQEGMENIYPLSVPLRVELKAGMNWYEMYPLERK